MHDFQLFVMSNLSRDLMDTTLDPTLDENYALLHVKYDLAWIFDY